MFLLSVGSGVVVLTVVQMDKRQHKPLISLNNRLERELVKNALRMRPDRIILGECRGEEAFDMLQAMNTGHEGSMANEIPTF